MLIDSEVLVRLTRGHHGMRLADALVGATAIEHGLALITANVKHFGAVEGLTIEALP
jgi:predicted nucleic acid-binding protein